MKEPTNVEQKGKSMFHDPLEGSTPPPESLEHSQPPQFVIDTERERRFSEEHLRRLDRWAASMDARGEAEAELKCLTQEGQKIRKLREGRGLNRQALSALVGVDPDLLFFIERGLAEKAEVAHAKEEIAKGLGITLGELEDILNGSAEQP
jgi:ribosome-binding protein aMBF1 (putative translation factor)